MQRALALKMFYVRAIPRSGYYSGASLGVRFIALLHYFLRCRYQRLRLTFAAEGYQGNSCALPSSIGWMWSEALSGEIILRPRPCSIFSRATLAALPPCLATRLFSFNPLGLYCLENSAVAASAKVLSANSKLVMLSRRFSFFNPLKCLYSRVVFSLQACVIISVNNAYSLPSLTPPRFHSSVNSLRVSIDFTRWLIQLSE